MGPGLGMVWNGKTGVPGGGFYGVGAGIPVPDFGGAGPGNFLEFFLETFSEKFLEKYFFRKSFWNFFLGKFFWEKNFKTRESVLRFMNFLLQEV